MDLFTSPCFIVHLSKHTERVPVYQRIKDAGFQQVRWFEAVDGNHLPTLRRILPWLRLPRLDPSLTSGALGCLLSHLCLLQQIIQQGIPQAVIFEDDVAFHPEWTRLAPLYLKKTPPYDVLFLGNQLDTCRVVREPGPEITQEPVYCTHGYVVTLEGAQKLYHTLVTWDPTNTPYSGLTIVDYMIKETQRRTRYSDQKPFVWYSWDGTRYPCAHNTLPLSFEHCRNSGLVFQDTRLPTTIQNTSRVNLEAAYVIPTRSRQIQKPLTFFQSK